ncbi:Hypothetical predicted protein [Olea europaea subsp. europaea]|uniref:Uncharacterized protein n=1 Tax=Olea europaea subsp. europaea TaxID=158383 RepID=A0A8S0V335_OLEEU|nr:Hypothetical predicted protein [Olea europaea subsp. europaea]
MDFPQETDFYIKELIDDALGLPVSADALQLKLHASEDARLRLRNQYLCLHSKLKEKDNVIDSTRAEASINAVALKKFIEENQKLATECSNLLAQCDKWERECSLYDHDREALMDFANEADERATEAEIRVHDLEEHNKKLSEDLNLYKCRCEKQMIDVCTDDTSAEETLLDSLLATMFGKDEIASTAHKFLEAYSGIEACQKILKMWYSLRPSTQKVVALVAEAKNLEKDKDHLTINLHRAEKEVKLLFQENNLLDKENKSLMRQCYREQNSAASENSSSNSMKGNKRKSGLKLSSPVDKKIDLSDINSLRQPLSPLHPNSPESKMHKN